jgi:tripartite-type tricarboxylate transporter receptor subunit TctC
MLAFAAAVGAMLASLPAPAQELFPSRTVKIVVPAAAGSTTDILGRFMAEQLSQIWGKPVIVENIPGGGGNIGAANVARAAPDGHTLLVAPPLSLSYGHLLHNNLGFEPARFVPITLLATIPNVLVVRRELPVTTLQQLIEYGKPNPDKLSYASGGVGTTSHLTAEMFGIQAGIKMVRVAYRSSQPALTDVVAGHVDMFFDTLATSVRLYRDNKVKLLAVADVKRAAVAPEIPTFAEAGLPGIQSVTWFGMVAPPDTPTALADRINREAVEILKSKEVGDFLRSISLNVGATSRADTIKYFAEETARWSKVIKAVGIEPQ